MKLEEGMFRINIIIVMALWSICSWSINTLGLNNGV